VTTIGALLTAYDEQMRGVGSNPPAGVRYEQDGPLLRVVGEYRGYISGPRDLGVAGAELDRLIARQRDYFAARGEAVGWQTRAHDEPADAGRLDPAAVAWPRDLPGAYHRLRVDASPASSHAANPAKGHSFVIVVDFCHMEHQIHHDHGKAGSAVGVLLGGEAAGQHVLGERAGGLAKHAADVGVSLHELRGPR
jgi:hypothetical protein